MTRTLQGLHHVTAISGPPQANLDFYTGPLGQRFVKKTVNFDDPGTYHLYYGDRKAAPGSIMTFFPFEHAGPGRAGPGMASAVAYAVPQGGLDAWMERLAGRGIDFEGPGARFGERLITVRDPDGLPVDLIETDAAQAPGVGATTDGFHGVTLWLTELEPTARLLVDVFGYETAGEERDGEGARLRLQASGIGRASVVDLYRTKRHALARPGAGTIHHVAYRARDDEEQGAWREAVMRAGLHVTPVIDRQYFHSIYFREPGGVLFEIATDPPGFVVDEPEAELGQSLKLPPQHEPRRALIERRLPPLKVLAT